MTLVQHNIAGYFLLELGHFRMCYVLYLVYNRESEDLGTWVGTEHRKLRNLWPTAGLPKIPGRFLLPR